LLLWSVWVSIVDRKVGRSVDPAPVNPTGCHVQVKQCYEAFLPYAGPASCRVNLIHFLTGWHKTQREPGFSFVCMCFKCCLDILRCQSAVVIFGSTSTSHVMV